MISRRTFAAAVSAIPLAMLAWIVGATPAAAAGIIPVEMGPTTVAVAPTDRSPTSQMPGRDRSPASGPPTTR